MAAPDPSFTFCVFAKPPRPGQVKTRLAAALGAPRAAELAQAFLLDCWNGLRELGWAETVLASTGPLDGLPGLDPARQLWDQGDGDLGARLERVLRRALAERPYALALGADAPGLPPRLLEAARDALRGGAPAVLGPAADGGFYLLGLARCPAGLLAGLPWSDPRTGAATLERLRAHGLEPVQLEPWFDVDEPADLDRLARHLAAGEVRAPRTAQLLGVRR